MLSITHLPIGLGIFGLICAVLVFLKVKSEPAGEGKVVEIGNEIHLGAMVFMKSEYSRLAIFCVICIVAIASSERNEYSNGLPAWRDLFRYRRLLWYVYRNPRKCENGSRRKR